MRPRARRFATVVLLLALLLLAVTGFTPGPQTSEHEAREQASFVPELQRYYSKPTVETSATYDDDADTWRIVLTEEVSRKTVARFAVVDDTGRAKNVKVSSRAAELDVPLPLRRGSREAGPRRRAGQGRALRARSLQHAMQSTRTASGRSTSTSMRAGWSAVAWWLLPVQAAESPDGTEADSISESDHAIPPSQAEVQQCY